MHHRSHQHLEEKESRSFFGAGISELSISDASNYLFQKPDVSFSFKSDEIEGHTTFSGRKTAVAAIGSTIQGILALKHVKNVTKDIFIVIAEHVGDHGQEQSAFTVLKKISSFDIQKSIELTKSSGSIAFSISIPDTAVPTFDRKSHILEAEGFKGTRIHVTAKAFVAVAQEMPEPEPPRILGWMPIHLISNRLPPQLAYLETREWTRTLSSNVTYTLKLTMGRTCIGPTMDFDLTCSHGTIEPSWVTSIKLSEDMLYALDEPTEHALDFYFMESILNSSNPELKSLEWLDQHEHHRSVGSGKRIRVTRIYHHEYEGRIKETLEPLAHGIKFMAALPHQPQFLSTFSTKRIFNFWSVCVKLSLAEITFGPIGITWDAEIDTDQIPTPKLNSSCSLL